MLIAEIEGKSVLINTAAPNSIAQEPEWLFLNEVYPFQPESSGITCEGLSKALGTWVDVMLGMDILCDLHLRMNPAVGVIQFSRRPFCSTGMRLPLHDDGAGPATQLTIERQAKAL